MNELLLNRITTNNAILAGKPVIRGMRISVEQIVKAVAAGISFEELLQDYPELETEDIKAALTYAAMLVAEQKINDIESCRMKLLFDIGVSKIVEEHFIRQEFDVLAIRSMNASMPDYEILALAI